MDFCLDNIKWIAGPAATVIAAFAVTYYARRQAKIASNKLRLDLFEKRYELFELIHSDLQSILLNPLGSRDETWSLVRNMERISWFFDSKVEQHARGTLTDAIDSLKMHCSRVDAIERNSGDPDYHRKLHEAYEHKKEAFINADKARAEFVALVGNQIRLLE